MKRLFLAASALVALITAACTTQNQVLLPPPGSTPLPGILYVANGHAVSAANRGKIFDYTLPVTGASSPNFTLVTGNASSALESFAFDSSNVYVADCRDAVVRAFARPLISSSTQAFAIAAVGPDGIAIDSAGNLYAGNDCTVGADTITVYAPPLSGSSTASVTVTDASNINSLQQMAIDSSSSHLYEAQCASTKQVLEYNLPLTNSSTAAVAVTIGGGDSCDKGIAINTATNQLFVASDHFNRIYAFNLPISSSSTPALTINTSNASQTWQNIAFDANGNLYASDDSTSAIDVFVPPFSSSSNPAFSLVPAGIDRPWGLNIGPR